MVEMHTKQEYQPFDHQINNYDLMTQHKVYLKLEAKFEPHLAAQIPALQAEISESN